MHRTLVAVSARRGWPSGRVTASFAVPKGKKTKTGIYHPPKSGMPYLVVTVSPEGVSATAVESKDEARILASKKTMAVAVDDRSKRAEGGTAAPSEN